jgi:hypothetical protein
MRGRPAAHCRPRPSTAVSPRGEFAHNGAQRFSRKSAGRFAECAERNPADAEQLLHLVQTTGLLQGAQAGDDRVEEIQQQGGVLIEEQFAVAGLADRSIIALTGSESAAPRIQAQDAPKISSLTSYLTK